LSQNEPSDRLLDNHLAAEDPTAGVNALSWNELSFLLKAAVASSRAVGLEITIFNPILDQGSRYERELADAVADGLVPRRGE
jgi:arginase family enzyme